MMRNSPPTHVYNKAIKAYLAYPNVKSESDLSKVLLLIGSKK